MTREKAIKHLGYVRDNNIPISSDAFDALSMAISALEQPEPCEDAVSREALRKAMYHRAFETDGDTMWQSGCWVRYRAVEQVIKESPSVTPKRKTGKWEEKAVSDEKVIDEWQSARCSACGKYHTAPYMYYFNNYNFCPNCGARMTEADV